MINGEFKFKHFSILQNGSAMKVGTDGVLLGAWAEGGRRILDIGTGTGLIALMMAQRFTDACVDAIDANADACRLASENAAKSLFADRISVSHCRFQSFWPQAGRYDAIVCNPPYFVNSLKNPDKMRSMARHADSLPFEELAKGAAALLNYGGAFSVVLPTVSLEAFMLEAVVSRLFLGRQTMVSTVDKKEPTRVLLTFYKRQPATLEMDTVCLMEDNGRKTDWFSQLTSDFYIS